MSAEQSTQVPLAIAGTDKRDVRTQFAALCYKMSGKSAEVLLITSRGTGRWIIPKGWPKAEQAPHEAALEEAWEEAGVRGTADPRPLGLYSYMKEIDDGDDLPCAVMVYAIRVEGLEKDFPERDERKREWMSLKQAAKRVDEPELAHLLSTFDPDALN